MKDYFQALILVITLLPRDFANADILVQPGYDQPHARIAYPPYQHVQQDISEPLSNLYKHYWPQQQQQQQQFRGLHPVRHNQVVGYPLINYPYYHFPTHFLPRYAVPPRHLHLAKVGGLKIVEPSWYFDNRVANPLAVQARYRRNADEPSGSETTGKSDHVAADTSLIHSAATGKNIEIHRSNNYSPIYAYRGSYPAHHQYPIPIKIDQPVIPKNSEQSQSKGNVDKDKNHNSDAKQQLNSEKGTEEKKIAQRQISYEPNLALSSTQTDNESQNKATESQSTDGASSEIGARNYMEPKSFKIYHTVPLSVFYAHKHPGVLDKLNGKSYAIGTSTNENSVAIPENIYYTATPSPTRSYYYDHQKFLPYTSNYSPYSSMGSETAHLVYQNTYGYPTNVETSSTGSQAPLAQYHPVSYQTQELPEADNVPATQYFGQPQSYDYAQKYTVPSSYWSPPYSTFYVKTPNSGTPRMSYVPVHVRLT